MGGGTFSSKAYDDAAKVRAATGKKDFGYDDDIKAGRASGIHETLDPAKMTNSMRESRDSDEHPESLPVAIIFDVTGSMGRIPQVLQKKLVKLMDVVIDKAGILHPQILVGAVGDSSPGFRDGMTDRYPFQVGQFESDNRFDEQLRNIIIESGGGGQVMESYGLAYRFAAYHTVTDSFEKRGKKGYFFTMGDESFWPKVTAAEVQKIFGVGTQEDETVESLLAKVQEKWEVFHLFAKDGSYPDRADIHESWRKILGERFVMVEDSSLVCEVIAGLVHSLESAKGLDDVINDLGLSKADASVVKNAIVPFVGANVPSAVAKGSLPGGHADGPSGVSAL